MGYTEFGKMIKKSMIDNNENLLDIANLLNVTSSFVSAVLVGKKVAPYEWLDIISKHFDYDKNQQSKLYDAYCETKNSIKIDTTNSSFEKKKLALQFQRRLEELSEDEIKSLMEILKEDK